MAPTKAPSNGKWDCRLQPVADAHLVGFVVVTCEIVLGSKIDRPQLLLSASIQAFRDEPPTHTSKFGKRARPTNDTGP